MADEELFFSGADFQNRGGVVNSPHYTFNAYLLAGVWKYKTTNFAFKIEFNNATGLMSFYTAPSGAIDTNITWTARQTLDPNGNVFSKNIAIGGSLDGFGANFRVLELIGQSITEGGILFLKTSDGSLQGDITLESSELRVGTVTAHALILRTQNTQRVKITSSGVVELSQGQIKFPATANPSSDVNTLDDYEEGTFTAGIAFGGGNTGITYSSNTFNYVKVGKKVSIWGQLILTNKGSSIGGARLTGLPFTAAEGASASLGYSDAVTFAGETRAYVGGGGTTILLDQCSTGGTQSNLQETNFANNSQFQVYAEYII